MIYAYSGSKFQPSYPKITTKSQVGTDNRTTNGYALSTGKGLYRMFIPKDSERVKAVLPKPAGRKMKITWFNMFTGAYREEGIRNWSGWMGLISPWQ